MGTRRSRSESTWKTYLGRPESNLTRRFAMNMLANGLSDAKYDAESLSVQEVELATLRRFGGTEGDLLSLQGNLASTYLHLGRIEQASRMQRDVYFGWLKLLGLQDPNTLREANNYADTLNCQRRFEEAKSVLRRTVPVAPRVYGENHELTFKMRKVYAEALYKDPSASLDDLNEAVTRLEDLDRTGRRVLGGANPFTEGVGRELLQARAALRARETPSETPSETPGSFQRASEEKLRTRRVVSVADRFRRPAAKTPGGDDSRSTDL